MWCVDGERRHCFLPGKDRAKVCNRKLSGGMLCHGAMASRGGSIFYGLFDVWPAVVWVRGAVGARTLVDKRGQGIYGICHVWALKEST